MTLAALLVHALTASGTVLGLLATLAVVAGDFRAAFLWLFGATLIDIVDGWLARLVRVRERQPQIDGARLDDIVDYVTFVFVPALLIHRAGLVPGSVSVPVAGAILLASAYGFSQTNAKTSDHFFTGFPSYWNVVALYLFAGQTPPLLNALLLSGLCGLVFVPIRYVYPSRTPTLRLPTLILGAIWGVLVFVVTLRLPARSPALLAASLIFPVYYTVLSLILHRKR